MNRQDSKKLPEKSENYREKYERLTGEPIPNGFHVHHIDEDRRNNDILNLVALPNKVHSAYHFAGGLNGGKRLSFKIQDSEDIRVSKYQRNSLLRLLETIDMCAPYVDRRNTLLLKIRSKNEEGGKS
jgi:hypothetical protein